jgi:hypothetical protein
MEEHRDTSLGEAIERIPVPPRDEAFLPGLLERLDAVDAERSAQASGRVSGGRRRGAARLLGRHKGGVAAAAALAAAIVLILTLTGIPGVRTTQAPPASALDRLVAAIDAGLAKVDTVQGVMVFDDPGNLTNRRLQKAMFAATSAGDRLVDVRFSPDWARAFSDYHTQLSALRKAKATYTKAAYRRALSDLKSVLLVPIRELLVQNAADHSFGIAVFSGNAVTRKLAFVRYANLGSYIGQPAIGLDYAERVWALATQLRATLADHPDITVTDTTYSGRPAFRVTVPATDGTPAWQAIIDKRFGITLAVRVLQPQTGTGSDPGVLAFHVERLRVNGVLAPATFTMKPDYRSAPPGVAGSPVVKTLDMAKGAPVAHVYAAAQLARVASGTELVPTYVPAGFRLTEVARYGAGRRTPLVLVYRRGMNELSVWSGRRVGNDTRRIRAFDRGTWPSPAGGGDELVRVHGGALDGVPAALSVAVGQQASIDAWTGSSEARVTGDLSRGELLAVVGSLRPLKGGGWGASPGDFVALLGVLVACVAVAATAVAWLAARRRGTAGRRELGVFGWPLIGLALVVVGAGLEWHALLHATGPGGYAERGWDEPLGRWVIAAAVMAAACAIWGQFAGRRRGPIRPKFLAGVLAAGALGGAAFAFVYLPSQARFVMDASSGASPTDESWLIRIVSSQFSPSAATGLYISIVGALFLLVGVLMMRRPESVTKR